MKTKKSIQAQVDDATKDMVELATRIEWLERGLRFIAEGKTDRPQELARQLLNHHVWLPEWEQEPWISPH